MALPARISYRPPAAADFPSRAPWRLEAARSVLLVHDMQHYFTRVYDEACPAYTAAVAGMGRLLAAARAHGIPVVYTAQPGDQTPHDRGVMWQVWGPGIRARPEDTTIIDALAPQAGERVQVKHRYSAFVRSDLETWMGDLGRTQLVIAGIYGHIGVLATATDAFMRDLEPFVVADAIADFGRAQHEQALGVVSGNGGVVTDVESVAAAFSTATESSGGGASAGAASEGSASEGAVAGWTGASGPDSPWELWLASRIGELLNDPAAGTGLVDRRDQDLFEAGLDSVRSFSLLDDLADRGVDVDFGDFVSAATPAFLLAEIERAGVPAP